MADNETKSNIPQQLREQKQQNHILLEENKKLRQRIDYLTQQLAEIQRLVYGRKSEKVNPDQLQLFIDEARGDSEPAEAKPVDDTPDYEEIPAHIRKKKKRSPSKTGRRK